MTVETMFSHAWLYRFHGTNQFADLAELATFNALPAGVTADCKCRILCLVAIRIPMLTRNQGGHTTTFTKQTNRLAMILTPMTIRGSM